MEEKELAVRAKNGSKEAFELLMRRYQKGLYNYIYRLTGQRDLAVDFTQEAFLKAYLSIDKYNPSYNFSTWLWRIAHNLVVDHFRKGKLNQVSLQMGKEGEEAEYEVESRDPGPYEKHLNRERKRIIMAALEKLPPQLRELIVLRHFQELSYQEISQVTGLAFHEVKSKLFRAREKLRKILEAYREAL